MRHSSNSSTIAVSLRFTKSVWLNNRASVDNLCSLKQCLSGHQQEVRKTSNRLDRKLNIKARRQLRASLAVSVLLNIQTIGAREYQVMSRLKLPKSPPLLCSRKAKAWPPLSLSSPKTLLFRRAQDRLTRGIRLALRTKSTAIITLKPQCQSRVLPCPNILEQLLHLRKPIRLLLRITSHRQLSRPAQMSTQTRTIALQVNSQAWPLQLRVTN